MALQKSAMVEVELVSQKVGILLKEDVMGIS